MKSWELRNSRLLGDLQQGDLVRITLPYSSSVEGVVKSFEEVNDQTTYLTIESHGKQLAHFNLQHIAEITRMG